MEPEKTDAAKPSPLDAERARLRKQGFTEAEINQILIARETGAQPAASDGHGAMTGVASNLAAAATYVRNFFPGMVADFVTMRNPAATSQARGQATVYLVFKAVVIVVIAYVVLQEFSQLQSMTSRSSAEACIARQKVVMDNLPGISLGGVQDTTSPQYMRWRRLREEYNRDCAGG